MRPQHITAENARLQPGLAGARAASMRPQHITAENRHARRTRPRPSSSFNEAAAYHCGKRQKSSQTDSCPKVASMRPQHITAENFRCW